MELDIFYLAKATGDHNMSKSFMEASQARKKAMESVFWSQAMGQWLDYWFSDNTCKVLLLFKTTFYLL